MRIGIAHHLGWAVAVTADAEHRVVDRRRIELLEGDLPAAPVHHEGGPWDEHRSGPPLDDAALAALVDRVRAAATSASARALDELAADLGSRVASLSLAAWPADFPTDIATMRRVPYEAKADSVMYRQVLADAAADRGWEVHRFDPKRVLVEFAALLGERAGEVLEGPRATLGPPWTKDHRIALASTVVAAER